MALFDWLTGDRTEQVRVAFEHLREMLQTGDEMFAAATGHLLDNEILELDLDRMDAEINSGEQQLRAAVLDHLSTHPDRQLVYILKLSSIVQEAERIGDLSKSIAALVPLSRGPRMGDLVVPVRDLRDQVIHMFALTRTGFHESSETSASDVLVRHDRAKSEARRLMAFYARSDSGSTNEAVIMALAARMIGRVSSHLANIASTVVLPFEQIRRSVEEDPLESPPSSRA